MRLRFLTSTPLDIRRGSGTFVGIRTLADALTALGAEVKVSAPRIHLPVYTAERLLFNEGLRLRPPRDCDVTVGFDMDGYRMAGRTAIPHIASIKGVIADELRFQRGLTRATMAVQMRCERLHARRPAMVVTTCKYAAGAIREHYGVEAAVVPELIDLAGWRGMLEHNPAAPEPGRFTVLCVCRLYRRKRVGVLLRAVARLRDVELRIVGDGPERDEFRAVWQELKLGDRVRWLGDVPAAQLAAEYNRCHCFCLPSVQEGFGIVFLEAMAAGKPIVAARAAAVPEVVRHGLLAEPDDAESLAGELEKLERDADLRASLAAKGAEWVQQFDAPRVGRMFLGLVAAGRGGLS